MPARMENGQIDRGSKSQRQALGFWHAVQTLVQRGTDASGHEAMPVERQHEQHPITHRHQSQKAIVLTGQQRPAVDLTRRGPRHKDPDKMDENPEG